MPNLLWSNTGIVKALYQKQTFLNSLTWHLFVNNYTIVQTTLLANFTECTDTGYAPLSAAGFGASYLFAPGVAEMDSFAWTTGFTFSGGAFTVYGYYTVDPATGLYVFGQNDATPFNVDAAGRTYTVTPKIQDQKI